MIRNPHTILSKPRERNPSKFQIMRQGNILDLETVGDDERNVEIPETYHDGRRRPILE